ncbi:hypothetical protein HX021_13775 [Sphingobacterium sp. N143]|uniref:hypothetical protein n=1 Tax=Sphingobacterium sp. N143 TaxID=2746727 RepID=UPI002576B85C|nr:hypothetical protein [Sphingobacterium sp. N143]MDM1295352.1 hypothetical protein [Sphingobacterium sp. N143]
MPTFNIFKEGVLSLYEEKKRKQEMDELLASPSPANLRDYCLIRLSEGLPEADILVLQKFFDPLKKEKSLEDAIYKYKTGWLRALQKFILGKTENPDELLVKLLAVLVDYQPRPFRYNYDNTPTQIDLDPPHTPPPIEDGSKMVPSTAVGPKGISQDEAVISEGDHEKTVDIDHVDTGQVISPEGADESQRNKDESGLQKKPFLNKHALRFTGAASLIVTIFITIHFLTPEDCMCWNGEKYIQVDCQDKTQAYQVIGLDQDRLEYFRKITQPDSLGVKDIGNIWYSKIDNEVEFFTGPGYHPVQPNKSLKAVTRHIWDTYVRIKPDSNQHVQLGIMQKQKE